MRQLRRFLRPLKNLCLQRDSYSGYSHYYKLTVFDRYTNLNSLVKIICETKTSDSYCTEETIKFKGKIDFGTPKSQVIKTLGSPFLYFENPELKSHTVIFYKCYIGNYKTNLELHFFNQIFFMGVFTFNQVSDPKEKNKIKDILFEKYKVSNEECKNENQIIVDKHQNRILINDNIHYSIVYISGNEIIQNNIKNNIEQITSLIKIKEQRITTHIKNNL